MGVPANKICSQCSQRMRRHTLPTIRNGSISMETVTTRLLMIKVRATVADCYCRQL